MVDPGQDDSNDGSNVDDGDDGDHDELPDRLLEPGHAALAGDACPEGGDGDGQGHHQHLQRSEKNIKIKFGGDSIVFH